MKISENRISPKFENSIQYWLLIIIFYYRLNNKIRNIYIQFEVYKITCCFNSTYAERAKKDLEIWLEVHLRKCGNKKDTDSALTGNTAF